MSTSYRRDIDGLRSMAILPVVLNHANIPGFPGGFVGVDIFFVISGYLITGILAREIAAGNFSIVGFYERRARRILPALFVVIAACFAAGWFVLLPGPFETMGKSAAAALLFLSNVWFWRSATDYFGPGVELEPLLHTWSLAVEEQFYLVFPLLLWLLAARPRREWVIVVLALSALSFAISVWGARASPVMAFYLPFSRIWELGLGALLAIAGDRIRAPGGVVAALAAAGLAMILATVVLLTEEVPFPGLAAVPPCLGAALLIWAGGQGSPLASRLLATAPLVWVGLISYSLYLWHWPVLVAARLVTGEGVLPIGIAAACLALSVALGWASWRFVERPFRTRPDRGGISRRGIFALSGAGTAALVAVAGLVVALNGVPARLPAETLRLHDTAVSRHVLDRTCMDAGAEPCRLGAGDGPARVMVWGDSHAGAMLPGIARWLETERLDGLAFTRRACLPLEGIRRADRRADDAALCEAHNARALAFLRAAPEIDTVILAARWALAAEGSRPPGEAGRPALLARPGTAPPGIAGNAELLRAGLARTLAALSDAGKRVVLVASVPETGFDVPREFATARLVGRPDPAAPATAAVRARQARSGAILRDLAARHGAIVVWPVERMCADDCRVREGPALLYRDDDHLSAYGAEWLMPGLLGAALDGGS